jgi:RNA polymerase sigma factor (sigma-70 family)
MIEFPEAAVRVLADERKAIAAAAGGSHSAFEQLYRRHAGRIYGLCLRLTGHRETAEDCVQETFVSAWRGLARFEARSAFATWLHRIAVNTVMARHRVRMATLESTTDASAEATRRPRMRSASPSAPAKHSYTAPGRCWPSASISRRRVYERS